MDPKPTIHLYDTQTRTIRCGASGHTGSTKHRRGVTCERCLDGVEPSASERPPERLEADTLG